MESLWVHPKKIWGFDQKVWSLIPKEMNLLVIVKLYVIRTAACDPYEWNIPTEYNSAEVYGTQAWEISNKSDEMN